VLILMLPVVGTIQPRYIGINAKALVEPYFLLQYV
jgi:hypothetical protein